MASHEETPPGMRPLGATDPRQVAGYELRARLGSGGMGSVYLSYSPGGQPVALKVVRNELADDPEFRRRFETEVRAARRVQGVYTVPVVDSSTQGPVLWLATAYVPGPSLADVIRSHGPLPLETVLLLVAGVAEALQSIHAAGVIHRDLKPGNVLLAPDGPKVIDFGIARAADATSLTGTDVRVGTPSYMAPEQITGSPEAAAQPAVDVFALGLIAYYAATGEHPFGEGSAHAVLYRIVQDPPELGAAPEALRGLIGACLAKDPAARPSPAQVIEACRALAPGGTLRRAESWLPPPLAAELTTRLRARPPAPAAPPPVPPPPPAAPAAAPAIPASASARPGGRRMALLLTATAVAAAIVGGALASQVLEGGDGAAGEGEGEGDAQAGDGRETQSEPEGHGEEMTSPSTPDEAGGSAAEDGSGRGEDSAYTVMRSDAEVDIVAPIFDHDTREREDRCYGGNITEVDLDDLEVETNESYGTTVQPGIELQYSYCDHPGLVDNGIEFHPQVFTGLIDNPDATAEECYEAAHTPTLPHLIPVEDMWQDTTLHEDMGLCVETDEENVVLLWITEVTADPYNEDLRTYLTTATQWAPNP
ncbi:serine/threonine-protein kinase [Streptomyces sp. 6N223]|uniref:serine/threonine-protein kinase n=1 Tax=Streptomyces sp. 6N223 TaxID=3457412 RepID=UPI003FD039F1